MNAGGLIPSDLLEQYQVLLEQGREGAPSPAANAAEDFLWSHLLEHLVRQARHNSAAAIARVSELDLLVSLGGMSPLTTVLVFEILRPRRVLLLTSDEARRDIDRITGRLVGPGRLAQHQFEDRVCQANDPVEIYEVVSKKFAGAPGGAGERNLRAVIDITGGKKVFSAAAALAAWQLDLPICYLDSRFQKGHRILGSETLLLLDNPITLFGSEELRRADELFGTGAFAAAHARYRELAERIQEPAIARFKRDLAELYHAWCAFDFAEIRRLIPQVERGLATPRLRLGENVAGQIHTQLAYLNRLAEGDRDELLCSYYLLGRHYEQQGRYDFAMLLYYRTIESCLQQRLARQYSFDCSRPDYGLLGESRDELTERYVRLSRQLAAREQSGAVDSLPEKVGLFQGAMLLFLLEDKLLKRAGWKEVGALANLLERTAARNSSILAHGYQNITPDAAAKMRELAHILLKVYWSLEHEGADLDFRLVQLRFVSGLD